MLNIFWDLSVVYSFLKIARFAIKEVQIKICFTHVIIQRDIFNKLEVRTSKQAQHDPTRVKHQ